MFTAERDQSIQDDCTDRSPITQIVTTNYKIASENQRFRLSRLVFLLLSYIKSRGSALLRITFKISFSLAGEAFQANFSFIESLECKIFPSIITSRSTHACNGEHFVLSLALHFPGPASYLRSTKFSPLLVRLRLYPQFLRIILSAKNAEKGLHFRQIIFFRGLCGRLHFIRVFVECG